MRSQNTRLSGQPATTAREQLKASLLSEEICFAEPDTFFAGQHVTKAQEQHKALVLSDYSGLAELRHLLCWATCDTG